MHDGVFQMRCYLCKHLPSSIDMLHANPISSAILSFQCSLLNSTNHEGAVLCCSLLVSSKCSLQHCLVMYCQYFMPLEWEAKLRTGTKSQANLLFLYQWERARRMILNRNVTRYCYSHVCTHRSQVGALPQLSIGGDDDYPQAIYNSHMRMKIML